MTPETAPSPAAIPAADQTGVRSVVVSTPARLHFGLASIGENLPVNYGGAGLMIDGPRTRIEVSPSSGFSVSGADPGWIAGLARQWMAAFAGDCRRMQTIPDGLPPVQIRIQSATPRHAGLGSGTQMALAVGAALCQLFHRTLPGPMELAVGMGRGRRSSIGSWGFFQGGFLVDQGLAAGQRFSELAVRIEFPTQWPVVVVLPELAPGTHGLAEQEAFGPSASSSAAQREALLRLLVEEILPAVTAADYPAFARAIHEFNRRSGDYYPQTQPTGYHSPAVAGLVQFILDAGCPAVVQSSWGPGIAAVAADLEQAENLRLRLECLPNGSRPTVHFARACNRGAEITVRSPASSGDPR